MHQQWASYVNYSKDLFFWTISKSFEGNLVVLLSCVHRENSIIHFPAMNTSFWLYSSSAVPKCFLLAIISAVFSRIYFRMHLKFQIKNLISFCLLLLAACASRQENLFNNPIPRIFATGKYLYNYILQSSKFLV